MAGKIETLDEAIVTVRTGTVKDNQTSHRTHINAHTTSRHDAGTGHGHSDTTVSSSSSELLRLFIQEDGGREFEANATNAGFGFRTGHRASVIYLGPEQAPVGLINHSTDAARIFESDVKRQVGGPTHGMMALLTLAMVIVGPILVWNLWGSVSAEMRPEWQDADLGELFFRAMTAGVVGVLGGLALPALVMNMAVKLGVLPKPAPSLTSQVMARVEEAKAAVMAAEDARAGAPVLGQ